MSRRYLTLDEALYLHEDQVASYGGSPGIRDRGLIEAALLRPQTGYYADTVEEAAALWESLTMNHGFVDGNKRVALACVDLFLNLNGLDVSASAEGLEAFIYGSIEGGTFRKDELDAWLRENTEPRRET